MSKNKREKQSQKTTPSNKNKLSPQKIVVVVLVAAGLFYFAYNNFLRDEPSEVKYYSFKKEGELVFSDSSGTQLAKIDIEIADDDYSRQLGLMNRKGMEENQGMLFIFPEEQFQSFWMLNTLFSLDMLFINKEKKIVTIHKNTTPLAQKSYPSSKPALYVLEVNAGFTDKHSIKEGDKVNWMGIVLRNPE